jgi:hypothetical protein
MNTPTGNPPSSGGGGCQIWLNRDAGLRLITGLAVALAVLAVLLLAGSIR